jgi:drug/metabolite transporter (DMT)-like permease
VGDFTGGLASRRIPAPSVAVGVAAVGFIAIPFGIIVLPARWDVEAMALTFAGGAIGGFGLVLFYRAMALDLIGVVAPVTAVIAASLPTAMGMIAGGEKLHLGQAAGIVAGLVAIALINGGGSATRRRAGQAVGLAVVAGATFGLFFVLYHAGSSAGVTAFVSGRVGSWTVAAMYALVTRVTLVPPAGTRRMIAFAGAVDGTGVILYLYATFHGLLSISAVLASFYPAFTILCARFVLVERLTVVQAAGAVLAIFAVAAIAAA